MIHQILDRRYELLEHVGGGGMADVYRAHDQLLDRYVAVKILHAQFANDEEFIEKFRREAQGAAKLSHPNIVNIYDVGKEGTKHYIVMEYVAGETLKDRIQREGRLSVAEALRMAREIAEALEHAHANNLVHCDIKPHNILVTEANHIKVADFGIARAVTASTMTYSGTVVGSVHYFSPEQAKGGAISPKSDVYALGVVLYEMLTGAVPFTGETPVSIALKHLQETPLPVRKTDPEIPAMVEAIVLKAMEKDPANRFTSTEMIQAILRAERMLFEPSSAPSPASQDPFATQVLQRVQEEDLPEYSKRMPEKSNASAFKSKKFMLGLIAVLTFGFLVGAFLSYGEFWSNSEVKVPDVVGKQADVAKKLLEESKLRVNVAETYDANMPAGKVVSQTPEAGATVKEKRLVTIYVSKGGENIEMPDLRGLTKANAEAKLKKLGLKLGTVDEEYADEDAGTVISQNPRVGSQIAKGQAVNITVSKGKKTKKTNVPDFTGSMINSVETQLKSLNLRIGNVVEVESPKPAGTILKQSPAGGTAIDEGSSIEFTVAKQEKAAEKNTAKNSTKNTGKEIDKNAKTEDVAKNGR